MDARYKISESDYVAAVKLGSKMTLKQKLVVLIIILIGLIGVFCDPESLIHSLAIGGLAGVVLALLLRLFLPPFTSRRNYRKYKAIQDEIQVKLLEEGVEFSNADGVGVLRWEKILKWRENDRFILIFMMPRIFHIIPKVTEHAEFDWCKVVEALKEQVGPDEFTIGRK